MAHPLFPLVSTHSTILLMTMIIMFIAYIFFLSSPIFHQVLEKNIIRCWIPSPCETKIGRTNKPKNIYIKLCSLLNGAIASQKPHQQTRRKNIYKEAGRKKILFPFLISCHHQHFTVFFSCALSLSFYFSIHLVLQIHIFIPLVSLI